MTHVLYVARDKEAPKQYCPGSQVCMDLAKQIEADLLNVQDVNVLVGKGVEMPAWLDGTPILVQNKVGSRALRGSEAIKALQALQRNFPLQVSAKQSVDAQGASAEALPMDSSEPSDPFAAIASEGADGGMSRDGKVTEQDVQRAIEERERRLPPAASAPK